MPKIEPVAGPTPGTPYTMGKTPAQSSAREAAINALLGNSAQPASNLSNPAGVANPSAVTAEELGAVKVRSNTSESPEAPASEQPQESQEAKPAAPETASEEKPLSQQYAQLARREKALRAQAQQLKAEKAALEAEKAKLQSSPQAQATIDESKYIPKDLLSKDPLTALLQAGVSYEQITQMMLNQPQMDPATKVIIDELKAEIRALKGETESVKKTAAEQQEQSYQQALKQIRNETIQLVSSDPSFETIKSTGSVDDVVDLIERTFKEEGRLMTVEEAAGEVENYLVEEALKLARLKKIQEKLLPKQSAAAPKQSEQPKTQAQSPATKTLTNSLSTGRTLTAKERAMLAFRGELK